MTVIIADILQRLAGQLFRPFMIVLSNGTRHEVPTPDHCTVQRFSRRANVDHDDGIFVMISRCTSRRWNRCTNRPPEPVHAGTGGNA